MSSLDISSFYPETATPTALEFLFKPISSHLAQITIKVKHKTLEIIRKQTIQLYKKQVHAAGLAEIPDTYIENNYRKEINKSLQNFMLHHFVIDYLTHEIIEKKIAAANYPRLIAIEITNQNDIAYTFDISIAAPIDIREWKNFSFKAPKRKNYKDLDKQVALFLKDQCDFTVTNAPEIIENNDWVCFDAHLLTLNQEPIEDIHRNNLWLKIHLKAITQPLFNSFLGKTIGDSFITNDLNLLKNIEHRMCDHFFFRITLKAVVKGSSFALEAFKGMFKLKNKLEVHEKLIEVFSYRNDLSQRKAIIEEMFHLFFSKHRFEVPKHLVLRKQEEILNTIKQRPDYQVYKMQKNFLEQVGLLAEKQLKEEILIDQIAGSENIKTDLRDLQNYLNLFTNERLKEFVYFKPFGTNLEDSTTPLHHSLLKQVCRREKTLNFVLHFLTR